MGKYRVKSLLVLSVVWFFLIWFPLAPVWASDKGKKVSRHDTQKPKSGIITLDGKKAGKIVGQTVKRSKTPSRWIQAYALKRADIESLYVIHVKRQL